MFQANLTASIISKVTSHLESNQAPGTKQIPVDARGGLQFFPVYIIKKAVTKNSLAFLKAQTESFDSFNVIAHHTLYHNNAHESD